MPVLKELFSESYVAADGTIVDLLVDDDSDYTSEEQPNANIAFGMALKLFTRAAADCGANAEGGGGFQPGNSCAGGGSSGDAPSAPKSSGRKLREAFYGTKKDHSKILGLASTSHIASNEIDPIRAQTIKENFTTPEQKKQFTEVMQQTLDSLPPMMADVISRNVKDIKLAGSVDYVAYLADRDNPSKGLFGFFRYGTGELVLNGGPTKESKGWYGELTQHGIYAHEMAHAADRISNGNVFSEGKPWADAYAAEINRDDVPLSEYARISPQEGFAEFVRLMAIDTEKTKQKYPKCSQAVQSAYGSF